MLDYRAWDKLVRSFEGPTEEITKRVEVWGGLNELDHPPRFPLRLGCDAADVLRSACPKGEKCHLRIGVIPEWNWILIGICLYW